MAPLLPSAATQRSGFSLLEIICVLALLSVVLSLGAAAVGGLERGQRCRAGAEGLVQSLREAREAATRHGWRTRVVLSLPRPEKGDLPPEKQPPENAYAIFVFQVPVDVTQLPTWTAPARLVEGRAGAISVLSEYVAGGSPGFPEEFVGRWVSLPEHPLWTKLADGVKVDGEFVQEFTKKGFAAFAALHVYQPRASWDAASPREQQGFSNRSPFPVGYPLTTFPHCPPLVTRPLPATARVYDAAQGMEVPARDLWGDDPLPQFALHADDEVRPFSLPAIEFAPDGSLAGTQKTPLQVILHPVGGPQPAYEIVIDPFDGQATLLPP